MRKLAKRARFEILQKNQVTSKTGLGFEIRPSYYDVPTAPHCATVWQSSCRRYEIQDY